MVAPIMVAFTIVSVASIIALFSFDDQGVADDALAGAALAGALAGLAVMAFAGTRERQPVDDERIANDVKVAVSDMGQATDLIVRGELELDTFRTRNAIQYAEKLLEAAHRQHRTDLASQVDRALSAFRQAMERSRDGT
jgi:hypothetical protein